MLGGKPTLLSSLIARRRMRNSDSMTVQIQKTLSIDHERVGA